MEQFFKSRSTRSLPALFPLDTAIPAWPARAPHWRPSSLTLTSSWYSSQMGFSYIRSVTLFKTLHPPPISPQIKAEVLTGLQGHFPSSSPLCCLQAILSPQIPKHGFPSGPGLSQISLPSGPKSPFLQVLAQKPRDQRKLLGAEAPYPASSRLRVTTTHNAMFLLALHLSYYNGSSITAELCLANCSSTFHPPCLAHDRNSRTIC